MSRNLFRKNLSDPKYEKEIIIEPQDLKNLSVKYNKQNIWKGLKAKDTSESGFELRDDGIKVQKLDPSDVVTVLDKIEEKADQITNQVDIALNSLRSGVVTQGELERIRASSMMLSDAVTKKKNMYSTGFTNIPALTNKGTFNEVDSQGRLIVHPPLPALAAPPGALALTMPFTPSTTTFATPVATPAATPPPTPSPKRKLKQPTNATELMTMFIGDKILYNRLMIFNQMFPNFIPYFIASGVPAADMEASLTTLFRPITQQDVVTVQTKKGDNTVKKAIKKKISDHADSMLASTSSPIPPNVFSYSSHTKSINPSFW